MADTTQLSQHLSEAAAANVARWLTEPKYEIYKAEVQELIAAGAWQTLEDSFFKVIEFGTGGRRGTTGVGSARINKVTVGESAQALCQYALSVNPDAAQQGVAIAYDTRLSSPELSQFVARVCAANGFKVYVFESYRSTPELSFAVRELGCSIGVVITASHNPPADNGFKAYWSDGAQLVNPHDKGVIAFVESVQTIATVDYEKAVADGLIEHIGKEIDDKYVAAMIAEAEGTTRDLRIVYSPLHGAGQTNTLPALRAAGFADVRVVADQMTPDGNFPTIENNKANPEERAANDRAVAQMLAEDADIAITNDPDADRVGVMVRQGNEPVYLTGNQSFVLAVDYVLQRKQAKDDLRPGDFVAKTIVTTDMVTAVADTYGVRTYTNMLVGFKYIGSLIYQKENTDERFIIGGEESYGLLKGTYSRDKDGATGALPLAEYAAELKMQGKTLWDRMLELYAQYGLYMERLENIVAPGASGFERMQQVMRTLRAQPPKEVAGYQLTAISDYQTLERTDVQTGAVVPIDCTKGNVVVLEFGDSRRRLTIRPSGTEPKLKLYTQWYEPADASITIHQQYEDLAERLEGIGREMEGILMEPPTS
jgi:phosphomannomutase